MDELKVKLFEIVEQSRNKIKEYVRRLEVDPQEWNRISAEYSMAIRIINELKLEKDYEEWSVRTLF